MTAAPRRCALAVLSLLGAATISAAGVDPCTPSWSTEFSHPGSTTGIVCSTVLDMNDGRGPMLYVGGSFTSLGGARSAGVARWNGTAWESVGTGLYQNQQSPANVFSLAAYQGKLYACGRIHQVGPGTNPPAARQVNYLAVFDGTDWKKVGNGIPLSTSASPNRVMGFDFSAAQLHDMTVYDDGTGEKLYFTGNISRVLDSSGLPVSISGIGRWDGTSLGSLSGGGIGTFGHIDVHDEDGSGPLPRRLFVSGASGVHRWNHNSWTQLSGGETISNAGALASVDPDGDGPLLGALYSPVNFLGTDAFNNPYGGAFELGRWNGSSWSFVETGWAARTTSVCTPSLRTMRAPASVSMSRRITAPTRSRRPMASSSPTTARTCRT